MALNIAEGETFEDTRSGDKYEVLYEDSEVFLCRDEYGNHRLDSRKQFKKLVKAGRFNFDKEIQIDRENVSVEVPFEEISWVGETAANSLRQNGFETVRDIERASDNSLASCQAVGEKSIKNIREWVERV